MSNSNASIGEIILAIIIVFAIVFVIIALVALLTQAAWNVGVVGLIVACGGSAASISYKVAFWVTIALMLVKPSINVARGSSK